MHIHCILDGLDVPERTADVYCEALEIKLADIGIGRITATLCGWFFAMDSSENRERTARALTDARPRGRANARTMPLREFATRSFAAYRTNSSRPLLSSKGRTRFRCDG